MRISDKDLHEIRYEAHSLGGRRVLSARAGE
jgi:hypothetical protein